MADKTRGIEKHSKVPRIIGEKKREIKRLPPPADYRIHEWASPYTHDKISKLDVYVSEKASEKIQKHAEMLAKKNLEALGFLIGEVHQWKGRTYALVKDTVSTELDSTSVSVKFRQEGFEKLFEQLDEIDYEYMIVGWYHSHPGHTCFMSATDIDTQTKMFNKPYHTALVVDPINKEMKTYRLEGDHYAEKPYVIYNEKKKEEEKKNSNIKSNKEIRFNGLMSILFSIVFLILGIHHILFQPITPTFRFYLTLSIFYVAGAVIFLIFGLILVLQERLLIFTWKITEIIGKKRYTT